MLAAQLRVIRTLGAVQPRAPECLVACPCSRRTRSLFVRALKIPERTSETVWQSHSAFEGQQRQHLQHKSKRLRHARHSVGDSSDRSIDPG